LVFEALNIENKAGDVPQNTMTSNTAHYIFLALAKEPLKDQRLEQQ
jgi:hypothetical protein